eukprot:360988-Chlamydomonas_euryale.AAC.2
MTCGCAEVLERGRGGFATHTQHPHAVPCCFAGVHSATHTPHAVEPDCTHVDEAKTTLTVMRPRPHSR